MKIAVTSTGDTLESQVDPRFGRAKRLIVVDAETGSYEAADNIQNLNAAQGAGIQTAQNVAAKSVEAVITGHCGPNAFRTLVAANIKVYVGASGTVKEMVEKFKKGELREARHADVEGHW